MLGHTEVQIWCMVTSD